MAKASTTKKPGRVPPSRAGTVPITVRFPAEVSDQLKILAVEQRTTMQRLVAEACNDLFAKYDKHSVAPHEDKSE